MLSLGLPAMLPAKSRGTKKDVPMSLWLPLSRKRLRLHRELHSYGSCRGGENVMA